jgi:hypothetical protein
MVQSSQSAAGRRQETEGLPTAATYCHSAIATNYGGVAVD